MSDREVKRFVTTDRETVPFSLDGVNYVLVPASGLATRRYREAALSQAEMEVVGQQGGDQKHIFRRLQGVIGSQTRLVADCTYKVSADGGREGPLTQEFVEDTFPGDLIEWAFEEAKRISPWLDERDDGKNVERLEKRIKADQERLAKLKASDPKAEPTPSTTSSTARSA